MVRLPSILLVDDDYTVTFLNTKLLQHLDPDVQVLTARNGQQALDLLRTLGQPPTPSCPVLLFLDVKMPVMDGIEFLDAYQQLPAAERPAVVIVMLTTSVSPRDRDRLQHLPVADFLAKPLTQEQVERVLRQHFPEGS